MSLREELKEVVGRPELAGSGVVEAVIGVFQRYGWTAPERWAVLHQPLGGPHYEVWDTMVDEASIRFTHSDEKTCNRVCDLLNDVAPWKD